MHTDGNSRLCLRGASYPFLTAARAALIGFDALMGSNGCDRRMLCCGDGAKKDRERSSDTARMP
jgi:hypothetical protein